MSRGGGSNPNIPVKRWADNVSNCAIKNLRSALHHLNIEKTDHGLSVLKYEKSVHFQPPLTRLTMKAIFGVLQRWIGSQTDP